VLNHIFAGTSKPALQKPPKNAARSRKSTAGRDQVFQVWFSKAEKETLEDVYDVRDLLSALLGRPAITKTELVARLDSIDLQTLKESIQSCAVVLAQYNNHIPSS
jgi:hypothetical protein